MAKLTLTDITKVDSTAISAINANSSAIETALENTLSRDGTSPNTLGADLDLNSHAILNGGTGNFSSVRINGVVVTPTTAETVVTSFEDDVFEVKNSSDNTKAVTFDLSDITTGNSRVVSWPDQDGTVLLKENVSVEDLDFELYDNDDSTKKLKFDCSGLTTGNTRTMTVPDASGTLLLKENTVSDLLGIGGATGDSTNKLSVNSAAILFNRAVDSVQVKLNKQATGDSATFLFQTNFSGMAEIGLAGNNDFSFKTSANGSSFSTGLTLVNAASGVPRIPSFTVAGLPSAGTAAAGAIAFCSNEAGGAVLVFSDGTDWRRVTDRAVVS